MFSSQISYQDYRSNYEKKSLDLTKNRYSQCMICSLLYLNIIIINAAFTNKDWRIFMIRIYQHFMTQ